MELSKKEEATLKSIWEDEASKNVMQKAFVIAAKGTPDVLVGNIHTILDSIEGLLPEEDEDMEDKTS